MKRNSQSSPKKTPFAVKLLSVIAAIYLVGGCLIWAASSYFIKQEVSNQLKPYQLSLVDKGSISLNPFIFAIRIEDIAITNGQKETVSISEAVVDLNIFSLFATNISFDQLALTGITIDAERSKKQVNVAGFNLDDFANDNTQSEENTTQSDRGIDLTALALNEVSVNFADNGVQHNVAVNNIDVDRLSLGPFTQLVGFELNGTINNAPLTLVIKGDIFDRNGEIFTKAELKQFTFSKLAAYLPAQLTKLKGKTNLELSALTKINKKQIETNISKLALLVENLAVIADGYAVDLAALGIESEHGVLTLDENSELSARGNMSFSLSELGVVQHESKRHLLSINSMATSPINYALSQGKPSVDTQIITLKKFAFSQQVGEHKDNTMLKANKIEILPIKFKNKRVEVGEIAISSLYSNIIIDEDGQLANGPFAPVTGQEAAVGAVQDQVAIDKLKQERIEKAKTVRAQKPEKPVKFKLGKFYLSDTGAVYFNDESVKGGLERNVEIEKLSLTGLSNVDIDDVASFELKAGVDKHASIDLAGTVKPFTDKRNLSLRSTLSEFSLPHISAYLGKAAGVGFLSGQLDADIDMSVTNDELDGDTRLMLRGVELADHSDDKETKSGSTISLNTALGMLKDSKDNIELDIPMSGNVSDPSFGLGSFVGIITKKAVMSATETYLMQTFVPYANIVSIARVAGEAMLKVNVDDMHYAPQQITVDGSQLQFITELVNLLNDKSDLQLKMCPIATLKDGQSNSAKDNELLNVARKRAENLKTMLVTEKGISSKRLLLCQPKIDREKVRYLVLNLTCNLATLLRLGST